MARTRIKNKTSIHQRVIAISDWITEREKFKRMGWDYNYNIRK